MNPQIRNLVLSDGQLTATAGVIASGPRDWACRLNLTFTNVGASSETVVITYSRAGGTQRQLRQVVLDPDETFELTGLPINKADLVYAAATDAACVDYVVSVAADEAPLSSRVYDASGMPKTSPQIFEQLAAVLS